MTIVEVNDINKTLYYEILTILVDNSILYITIYTFLWKCFEKVLKLLK